MECTFKVREIARIFDVAEETVRTWIRKGILKATIDSTKDGYLIPLSSLVEFGDRNIRYRAMTILLLNRQNEEVESKTRINDSDSEAIGVLQYIIECIKFTNRIADLPTCNECLKAKTCKYVPKWGESVRYNCPFFEKFEVEEVQNDDV